MAELTPDDVAKLHRDLLALGEELRALLDASEEAARSPPSDEEVARVIALLAHRIVRLLIRRGLLEEGGPPQDDPLAQEEPLLAACVQASVRHRIATHLRYSSCLPEVAATGIPLNG